MTGKVLEYWQTGNILSSVWTTKNYSWILIRSCYDKFLHVLFTLRNIFWVANETKNPIFIFRKSQKSALIARRVAKSGGRSGSWRKTWSRSFRKNILGLDDPDDPEAARLRKYRTRRKKYGGKHFIIALYNCGKVSFIIRFIAFFKLILSKVYKSLKNALLSTI